MPKLGNFIPDSEIPCSRCHSRRKISKRWTEKIENTHGFMTLEHTQFICTNKVCQKEFDLEILADQEKRDRLKQIKLEDAAKRISLKPTT